LLILFLLFAVLPIAEIMLLINVSDSIGGWNTFFIVVFSAFIGAFFVKREGIATLRHVQEKSARGELPGKEISEGLLLLVAGVLLVTPGFITDAIGLLFTLPFTRGPIAAALVKQMIARQGKGGGVHFSFGQRSGFENQDFRSDHAPGSSTSSQQGGRTDRNGNRAGDVIDGEYQDKTSSSEDASDNDSKGLDDKRND
jgi:UPF0716 protein FxsA